MSRESHLFRLGIRMVVAGSSLVLGLVLLESGLRLARPDQRYLPYHRNSVKVFYPSEQITPGVSGTSYFTTNSLGTRGPELAGERVRLLTIGGSTTACTILDDSEEWPHVLMNCINDRAQDPTLLWVTNSGIDGLNSQHHLMHVEHLLSQLPEVDLVLVYAGLNDVGLWLYNEDLTPLRILTPEDRDNRIAESFRVCNVMASGLPWHKNLELWRQLSIIKDRVLSTRALASREESAIVQDANLRWMEEERKKRQERRKSFVHRAKLDTLPLALDAYADNLQKIVEGVRDQGAEPILVAQLVSQPLPDDKEDPSHWMGAMNGGEQYAKDSEVFRFVREYNRRMGEVAAKNNVLFLDPLADLATQQGLFYDGVHLNEEGARVFARWLSERLHPLVLAEEKRLSGRGAPLATEPGRGD